MLTLSPFSRVAELEQENARLQKENEEMRRLLGDADYRPHDPVPDHRRQSVCHYVDRADYNKKRRLSEDEELYLVGLSLACSVIMPLIFCLSSHSPTPVLHR